MSIDLYHKEVFIAIDEEIPRKNKIFILKEGEKQFEFLVTEIDQLSWQKQQTEEGYIDGLLVKFFGVYGGELKVK